MTIAKTKAAFLNAVRDNVKAKAAKKGIRLSKEALDYIVLQQASDAMQGDNQKVLNERLKELLDMC